MAETPDTDKLARREQPDAPAPDPITSRSTSAVMLISALLLTGVLVWSLYDEVYGMRPWKSYQQSFVKRFDRYLERLEKRGFESEEEVKKRPEYQRLEAEARAAREQARPRQAEIDRQVAFIDARLGAISDEFQDRRGRITVASYNVEQADDDDREDVRRDLEEMKGKKSVVVMPLDEKGERTERREMDFTELETQYVSLKDEKGRLLAEKGELLKPASDLERQRDEYLKNNVTAATEQTVRTLRASLEDFDYGMKQLNVNGDQMVDRCESCHLGIRQPINIRASDMMPAGRGRRSRPDRLARAFVSHPSSELLRIHDPEKFGCASCHWGNGRATTSEEKGHGRHKYWLHPLFQKENTEAGCNQCHAGDRVLQGAGVLNRGKDLYYERGCVGCHRYEGFDRETDALSNTRQLVQQLEDEATENEREAKVARAESSAPGVSDERAQGLLARAESLIVSNSQLEARIDQLNTQARYLMQDQKKVGPNLKDVRLKLRKEWIPEWLKDPQAFRPGTKMPTYWYLSGKNDTARGNIVPASMQDEERKSIAAYLWQSAYEGRVQPQPQGDARHGEELFKTRGCLACHSIGEGDQKIGGEFAADLTKVGQKSNYDYVVRWVHNPRERWAPYCPKEKRDLTPEDYRKHGKPFTFDTVRHSRCPNDGAELQVQNMTVMPNFRLSDQDARDIATYLVSLAPAAQYPDASYMDDRRLAEKGKTLIKAYGCAGCHEIRGFEDEQRIGKELTAEGATPLERLDFARLTHPAEHGEEPYAPGAEGPAANGHGGGGAGGSASGGGATRQDKEHKSWYNHKGFFEHKLEEPGIYDLGKEKDPREHLRMPKPFLKPEWKTALTTLLIGSVGREGANVPAAMFYNPTDQQKAIQDGWWVIKKYNCMGCHAVQVGQRSVLYGLPLYQPGGTLGEMQLGPDQLPPGLMTEGARVDPDWLLRFLADPSLSGYSEGIDLAAHGGKPAQRPPESNVGRGSASNRQSGPGTPPQELREGAAGPGSGAAQAGAQPQQTPPPGGEVMGKLLQQPGENRNGVRTYLRARMPTFNFSPNELRTLVRFFLAVSAQQEPYIKQQLEPLTPEERDLARALFTSQAAPCLKCHMTGDPGHDQTATAPNFLQAGERLKEDWTFRWLLDPQRIMPGTAMPSELFKRDGDRWVFNGPLPPSAAEYKGDHARLLVRYMLSLTPEEQARARSAQPAQAPAPSGTQAGPVASHTPGVAPRSAPAARRQNASRAVSKRGRGTQVSQHARQRRQSRARWLRQSRERWRQAATQRARARDFSP
ncbi:MAG: c-type cytochrome [Acidobacteria bacterium]|nr:c-type cytochrome [Acidobacteriota bacterium]